MIKMCVRTRMKPKILYLHQDDNPERLLDQDFGVSFAQLESHLEKID